MSNIREDLEDLTTEILVDNDMLYKVPVNVISIAKAYGIDVYETEFNNEISGIIRYDKEREKYEIIVNKNNAWVRKRFTIAHELGHYFLHRDMLKNNDIHVDALYRTAVQLDTQTNEREKEVDYFAGALLMNEKVIEKLMQNYEISDMAKILDVSYSAMTVRLNILGLF